MRNKSLIWAYPPNNWVSNYKQTFVYGWSNPKAKLFINDKKIKVFPNGNFAQTIKLPKRKNIVRLIQILNGRRKILKRTILVKKEQRKHNHVILRSKVTKNLLTFRDSSPAAQNDISLKALIIVIDPGHGGKEHGTHSPKGIPEKRFNLETTKLLLQKLKKKFKKVYLTRTKDKFVSLKQRVDFAKKKKCNFLISIHHNALPDNKDPLKHRGIGIYYTHNFVKPFAKLLLNNISKTSGLKKYGIFKRNFALTKPDFCPAVLIECGFLTHPIEAEYITRRKTQEKIVNGIARVLR